MYSTRLSEHTGRKQSHKRVYHTKQPSLSYDPKNNVSDLNSSTMNGSSNMINHQQFLHLQNTNSLLDSMKNSCLQSSANIQFDQAIKTVQK